MAKGKIDISFVEMTIADVMKLMKVLPHEIAIMMWGQPGIGKTFGLHSTFEPEGYRIIPVLAGCSEPTDITGIPFDYEGKCARYLAPEWAYLCSDDPTVPKEFRGKIILFFDDIVTAAEQTQAAFYKTVHERRVGNVHLRDNVRIIAAGNRLDDRSAVTEMPKALCNRFAHFYIRPDSDVWLDWGRKNGMHPDVMGFIRKSPNRISNFDDAIKSSIPAFATPRTWEMLSKALHILDENQLRGERKKANERDMSFRVASGIIGQGLASEFMTYVRNSHGMISPEEICKNPDKVKLPKAEEVDVVFATVSSAEHFIAKVENAEKVWFKEKGQEIHGWQSMLRFSMRIMPEFGVLIARQVIETIMEKLSHEHKTKAAGTKEFEMAFDRWGEHLAGIS